MTDIEQRALDLLNESRIAFGLSETDIFFRNQTPENEALCRALERQETAMTSELIEKIEALAKDAMKMMRRCWSIATGAMLRVRIMADRIAPPLKKPSPGGTAA